LLDVFDDSGVFKINQKAFVGKNLYYIVTLEYCHQCQGGSSKPLLYDRQRTSACGIQPGDHMIHKIRNKEHHVWKDCLLLEDNDELRTKGRPGLLVEHLNALTYFWIHNGYRMYTSFFFCEKYLLIINI